MKNIELRNRLLIICLLIMCLVSYAVSAQPIRLNPINPHYFEYKGKPVIIVSSGEHYGAVINPAFDYIKYLDTLQKDNMNYTRIFTGAMYWEVEDAFGITNNTLAPASGTALAPWKRSDTEGNTNGGNKFDLDQWDENYFNRFKSVVAEAQKRNIIVEVTLFTSIYGEKSWENCPVYPQNNINNIALSNYKKVHTLENGKLLQYQDKFVKRLVTELNKYDNVIYEIQNEPWADQDTVGNKPNVWQKSALDNWNAIPTSASIAWQTHIAKLITETEKTLDKTHLIAQNYNNFVYPVKDVIPEASGINFHYAWGEAVTLNYGWNKVIGFDESGFAGSDDDTYRQQAWVFIMSGGGLFNNLDYSFAVGHEDGKLSQKAPGGGSPLLRKQLFILRKFIESFDFIKFSPDKNVIALTPGAYSFALSNGKEQFAIYLTGIAKTLNLNLPAGKYRVQWMNPVDGAIVDSKTIDAQAAVTAVVMPEYSIDIVVSIVRIK